jgi:curved DNA-binding protein CbpA
MHSAYDVLGVAASADRETIRTAYLNLAKEFHPDRNPDDPQAKQRFQQINQAYELLKDAEKRSAYDQVLAFIRADVRRRRWRAAVVAVASFALTGTVSILVFLGPIPRQISALYAGGNGHLLSLGRSDGLPPAPGAPDFAEALQAAASAGRNRWEQAPPRGNARTSPQASAEAAVMRGAATRSPQTAGVPDGEAGRANAGGMTNQPQLAAPTNRPEAEATADRLAMLEPGALVAGPAAEAPRIWLTYRNDRFGFALDYPADVFAADERRLGDFWRLFVSHDGRARLLIIAGFNTKSLTPASYRRSLMSVAYAAAAFEYTPLRATWFVLAGSRGEEMFYERVTFGCGGRLIHGWRLTYPSAARAYYSRIIDRMHQGYKHARGPGAHCSEAGG